MFDVYILCLLLGKFGSGMHEFLLRKDGQGQVRLWFRKSSQASTWFPQGEGMLVFKTIPEGQPELKRGKPDAKWCRDKVETTVKAWFQFMSVLPTEAARIKATWTARFESLPLDGDTSQLPESQKLQWMDLPRDASSRGARADMAADSTHSQQTENPVVNPVTGFGRSAAEVAQELAKHKARMRAISKTAVFQADFLFVKLGDSGACIAHCQPAHAQMCTFAHSSAYTRSNVHFLSFLTSLHVWQRFHCSALRMVYVLMTHFIQRFPFRRQKCSTNRNRIWMAFGATLH